MNKTKFATNLLEQKEHGISMGRSLKKSWKRLLFRVVIIALAIFFYINLAQNDAFILAIGIILGGTLQDIGWIWRIGKTWGFTEEIIDWEKVKQIANDI